MTRGVVFDMDDTLYAERDYVRSGFTEVARFAGTTEDEIGIVFDWLWSAFEAGRRDDTFDGLLGAFPWLAERMTAAALVDAYRNHRPDIALTPGLTNELDRLAAGGLRLAVLSDGPPASQGAKATALGLDRWFDPVLLTGSLGPGFAKPGVAGFEQIARDWDLQGLELAYVADNPLKDFIAPRRLGWQTIRLRHPGQLRWQLESPSPADGPDLEIGAIASLAASLR